MKIQLRLDTALPLFRVNVMAKVDKTLCDPIDSETGAHIQLSYSVIVFARCADCTHLATYVFSRKIAVFEVCAFEYICYCR